MISRPTITPEREAEAAADEVCHRTSRYTCGLATGRSDGKVLLQSDTRMIWSPIKGARSATVYVISAGKVIYMGSAVSGHPGLGENEPERRDRFPMGAIISSQTT